MTTVNIFLGGGVALLEGDDTKVGYRPSVVDPAVSKLNSRPNSEHFYIVKTFSDLIHEYTPEGQQEHYHRFLTREADIALFIFDGAIGDKTKEEIERACHSNSKHGHPTVFFYGTNLKDDDDIVSYLNSKNQYFQHFKNKDQLVHLIQIDLSAWRHKPRSEKLNYRAYICPSVCAFSFLCMFLAVWFNGDAFTMTYLFLAFVWLMLIVGAFFNKSALGIEKLWKGLLTLGLAILFCFFACIVSIVFEEPTPEPSPVQEVTVGHEAE